MSILCQGEHRPMRLRAVTGERKLAASRGDDRPKQPTQTGRDLERGRCRLFQSDGGRRGSYRREPQGLSRHLSHREIEGRLPVGEAKSGPAFKPEPKIAMIGLPLGGT
jgi:hypothetical protein